MTAIVTAARIDTKDGQVAALLTLTPSGGGIQVVTVDGQPETRVHPASEVWNASLLSPDPMIPGKIVTCATYAEAVKAGEAWAKKLASAAAGFAELAAELAAPPPAPGGPPA